MAASLALVSLFPRCVRLWWRVTSGSNKNPTSPLAPTFPPLPTLDTQTSKEDLCLSLSHSDDMPSLFLSIQSTIATSTTKTKRHCLFFLLGYFFLSACFTPPPLFFLGTSKSTGHGQTRRRRLTSDQSSLFKTSVEEEKETGYQVDWMRDRLWRSRWA